LIEEQYQQVCDSCDLLLGAVDSTIERVAISWLHVLNEHPVNLARYESLFDLSHPAVPGVLRRVVNSLWGMRLRLTRGKPWHGPVMLPIRADVVIVSHLLNESQASESEDFYFGE